MDVPRQDGPHNEPRPAWTGDVTPARYRPDIAWLANLRGRLDPRKGVVVVREPLRPGMAALFLLLMFVGVVTSGVAAAAFLLHPSPQRDSADSREPAATSSPTTIWTSTKAPPASATTPTTTRVRPPTRPRPAGGGWAHAAYYQGAVNACDPTPAPVDSDPHGWPITSAVGMTRAAVNGSDGSAVGVLPCTLAELELPGEVFNRIAHEQAGTYGWTTTTNLKWSVGWGPDEVDDDIVGIKIHPVR